MDTPMEAVSGLMYTAAKCSGDITQEHKKAMLKIFKDEFEMEENDAISLLSSTSFLIKDEDDIVNNLKKFLELSLDQFSPEQRNKAITYVETVMNIDDNPSAKQQDFLDKLNDLMKLNKTQGGW